MTALSDSERLSACEAVIERGLTAFLEVGQALREIRDGALYKSAGYATWTSYLKARWGINTPQRAFQLMQASQLAQEVGEIGATLNEAQARALKDVPAPLRTYVVSVAAGAVKEAGVPLTASAIRRTSDVLQEIATTGAVTVGDEQFDIAGIVQGQVARELQEARARQLQHIAEARPSSVVYRGAVTVVGGQLTLDIPDGNYVVVVYQEGKHEQ